MKTHIIFVPKEMVPQIIPDGITNPNISSVTVNHSTDGNLIVTNVAKFNAQYICPKESREFLIAGKMLSKTKFVPVT